MRAASSQPTMKSVCRFNHKAFCDRPSCSAPNCDLCFIPQGSRQLQAPTDSQPAVSEDDRYGSVYIQGKGTVMTYMFEVRQEC